MESNEETETSLRVPAGNVLLPGNLAVPQGAQGFVIFVHGSGSSRKSRRNLAVAKVLNQSGLATLLFDLLTSEEEAADAVDGHLRFDIGFLAARLGHITRWMKGNALTRNLPFGYFGASTGAAAALVCAADRPADIKAVVSRGGRADLAREALPRVRAPTLLIVGERDEQVLAMNRAALSQLTVPSELSVVADATHLFAEPGALESVSKLATAWFLKHLP